MNPLMKPPTFSVTGRYTACAPRVEVRTGPADWLALPPSHVLRWETPPWIEPTTTKPRDLLNGGDVGRTPGGGLQRGGRRAVEQSAGDDIAESRS